MGGCQALSYFGNKVTVMKVKKVLQSEASGAMDLVWSVFAEFEAPEYSQEGINTFHDYINNTHEIGKLEIYGAYENDNIVGVIATRNGGSHIALFFVNKKYHRQGIGRKLFEAVLLNSTANEITVNSSPYAAEVYHKLGFVDTDIEQTKDGIRYIPMKFKRNEADEKRKAIIKDEFNNKISRLTQSRAYLDYCEEVYGYREYLFNMTDKQQIDFILNSVPVSACDTVLDLGCGSGSVLNLLSTKYGCKGIGIDRLNGDIVEKNGNRITYINGDIDRVSEYDLKPTITLSVDSLYFSSDLDKLLRQLSSFENNKMYLFYSQYLFDEASADRSMLKSNNTKLAKVLQKNSIKYDTIDFSDNERILYENSLRALKKYKHAFEREDNSDLYEQKLKEDIMGMELYNKKLAARFLYITKSY